MKKYTDRCGWSFSSTVKILMITLGRKIKLFPRSIKYLTNLDLAISLKHALVVLFLRADVVAALLENKVNLYQVKVFSIPIVMSLVQ